MKKHGGPSKASDLQKISSKIICSNDIIRQSLNHEPSTSIPSDEDHEFFQKLKSEIDRDFFLHSRKENCKPNRYIQNTALRKKRCMFDEETENVIKRFKKDADCNNGLQTLNDKSITHCSSSTVNNVAKERNNMFINTNTENIIQDGNILNRNFRNPSSEQHFKLQVNERTIIQAEYEECLFYELTYPTPPNSMLSEDITDS